MRPGPKPDPRSTGRNALAEWTDVDDVAFDYAADGRVLPDSRDWDTQTQDWFSIIASLPHAVLWRDGDWRGIYDLAAMKDIFYVGGSMNAAFLAETRQRENHFGLTEEARFKSRIRYVPLGEQPAVSGAPVAAAAEQFAVPDASAKDVVQIASARDRLRRGA